MPVEVNSLVKNYASAVVEKNGALFLGAGMSRKAGFVDWKGFLEPFARELGIILEPERDLVALAQYYVNSKNGERSFLNQALLDEFDRPGTFLRSHEIIANLPISMIWTTNYDELIEYGFLEANKYLDPKKYLDVKIRDKDIGFSRKECATVLYKMHGDISQPDKVIITKEDYERYQRTHPVFQHALTTALLGKTFLFLGLSFDDPNLNYTLGHLCALLENKKRVHYVVLRDLRQKGELSESDTVLTFTESKTVYEEKRRKQNLRINDLQRYGIETVLVNCFSQVTGILELVGFRITLFQHLKEKYGILSDKELNKIVDKHMPGLCDPCQKCRSIRKRIEFVGP
jgi:hypothetical protein